MDARFGIHLVLSVPAKDGARDQAQEQASTVLSLREMLKAAFRAGGITDQRLDDAIDAAHEGRVCWEDYGVHDPLSVRKTHTDFLQASSYLRGRAGNADGVPGGFRRVSPGSVVKQ